MLRMLADKALGVHKGLRNEAEEVCDQPTVRPAEVREHGEGVERLLRDNVRTGKLNRAETFSANAS